MSSDFECKECKFRLKDFDAIFMLEMAANYSHDGKNFRQQALRVVGCTLDDNMSTTITRCVNCGTEGTVVEVYTIILVCRNCGNDVHPSENGGGYCDYNGGVYCSRCYKSVQVNCINCVRRSKCALCAGDQSAKESHPKNSRVILDDTFGDVGDDDVDDFYDSDDLN